MIDSGVVKQRFFNVKSGIDALRIVPISKSQAKQRSGRAGNDHIFTACLFANERGIFALGRQSRGKAFRLYTVETYHSLEENTQAEIARTNLAEVVLKLKATGIDDVLRFDFLSPPPRLALLRSLETLYVLGALSDEGHITHPIGKRMSRLPLEPCLSRVLLAAFDQGHDSV